MYSSLTFDDQSASATFSDQPRGGALSMDGRIFSLKLLLTERLEHSWTIEEMAAGLELSIPHFQKLFRAQVGMPPIMYLKELRLERARKLLETTSPIRIKAVRYKTGLTDAGHFTRDFKKKFGMTPTEYREQYWEKLQHITQPTGIE